MKFIREINNDLVNMSRVDAVIFVDKGPDTLERFEIQVVAGANKFTLKKYRSESSANGFLRRIYEHYKFEVTE